MKMLIRGILLSVILVVLLFPLSVFSSPIDQLQNNYFSRSYSGIGNNFLSDGEGNIYSLIYESGLYKKSNVLGDVWGQLATINNKLPSEASYSGAVIDPHNSNIFYIVAWAGVRSFESAKSSKVYRTTDFGNKWEAIVSLPGIESVFINPHDNNELFIGTRTGLFRYGNGEVNPTNLNITYPNAGVVSFVINPENHLIHYALLFDGNTKLVTSKDAGKTWNRMDTALPSMAVKGKGRTAKKSPLPVKGFFYVNHSKPFMTVYAQEQETGKMRLFKTENNGVSWVEAKSPDSAGWNIDAVYVDDSAVYLGGEGCIYKSKNGINWGKIDLGKNGINVSVTGITKDNEGKGLFIATGEDKVLHIDDNGNLIGGEKTENIIYTAAAPYTIEARDKLEAARKKLSAPTFSIPPAEKDIKQRVEWIYKVYSTAGYDLDNSIQKLAQDLERDNENLIDLGRRRTLEISYDAIKAYEDRKTNFLKYFSNNTVRAMFKIYKMYKESPPPAPAPNPNPNTAPALDLASFPASSKFDGHLALDTPETDFVDTEPLYTLSGEINNSAESPDGQLLAVGSGNLLRLFGLNSLTLKNQVNFEREIQDITFSPDGKYLAVGLAKGCKVYDVKNWNAITTVWEKTDVASVSFSPDGRFLAIRHRYNDYYLGFYMVRIYEVGTWAEVAHIQHEGIINAIDFSSNGYFATTSRDAVHVYYIATWRKVVEVNHKTSLNWAYFTEPPIYLMTGGGKMVRFFDVRNWQEVFTPNEGKSIYSKVSPNLCYFAQGTTDDTLKVYELSSRKEISAIPHGGEILKLSFSRDSCNIITDANNQPVRVIETETGECIKEIKNFTLNFRGGNWLFGSRDKKSVVFDISALTTKHLIKDLNRRGFKQQADALYTRSQEIETDFQNKLKAITTERDEALAKLSNTQKDEFETQEEYKKRLAERDFIMDFKINSPFEDNRLLLRRERTDKRIELLKQYEEELNRLLNATHKPIQNLNVFLKDYIADAEIFPVSITENGAEYFTGHANVPRAEAKDLKGRSEKLQLVGDTQLDRTGRIKLVDASIKDPETGKEYPITNPAFVGLTF